MKCEEAAEFVSALCDGEKIPRAAAEHVGECDVCATRLTEYAEMGAELRRVASLESTETSPLTWAKAGENKIELVAEGMGDYANSENRVCVAVGRGSGAGFWPGDLEGTRTKSGASPDADSQVRRPVFHSVPAVEPTTATC